MSDYISKQAVNKKLLHESIFKRMEKEIPESRAGLGGYHTGKRDAYLNVIADLVLGKFDTSDQGEAARLREALEQIKNHEMDLYAERSDFVNSYYLLQELAEQALSGDTEPVGAQKENNKCNHCQGTGIHTQDGFCYWCNGKGIKTGEGNLK